MLLSSKHLFMIFDLCYDAKGVMVLSSGNICFINQKYQNNNNNIPATISTWLLWAYCDFFIAILYLTTLLSTGFVPAAVLNDLGFCINGFCTCLCDIPRLALSDFVPALSTDYGYRFGNGEKKETTTLLGVRETASYKFGAVPHKRSWEQENWWSISKEKQETWIAITNEFNNSNVTQTVSIYILLYIDLFH